ncbi:hypothetical protein X740_25210 [Mesorhizobium sp. LNHC221B00]|nr:hypothetical protein X742_31570 [Mesorhizobium sp. LNHC232B00]ESY77261.1 hypothetical protein X740_25210 [Mesorhizobium sp. LNHC221B00]
MVKPNRIKHGTFEGGFKAFFHIGFNRVYISSARRQPLRFENVFTRNFMIIPTRPPVAGA